MFDLLSSVSTEQSDGGLSDSSTAELHLSGSWLSGSLNIHISSAIRGNFFREFYKRSREAIHSLVFSLEGGAWQKPEPSHVIIMALAHCILGKFVGAVCHCVPPKEAINFINFQGTFHLYIFQSFPSFRPTKSYVSTRSISHVCSLRFGPICW